MSTNCKHTIKKEYFSEKEMIKLVNIYQQNKSEFVFKEMLPSIRKMIDGMINKQFSYNHHIINNRGDAVSECYFQILTSLERYDSNRGRLFAYLNRIIKNTLMSYYNKSRKIKDKEMNYTELNRSSEEDECIELDSIAIFSNGDNTNTTINESYDVESELSLKASLNSKILSKYDTIHIAYHYIVNLKEIFKYFMNNDYTEYIINNKSEFEFINNSYSLMSKKIFYNRLISNLYNVTNEIINWLENEYPPELLNFEPETYNGQWSNRAIGYVRKFINTKLKTDNLVNSFNIDDLIQFIYFLINLRYEIDE